MKTITLHRLHDPGHSWLKVPAQLLMDSGAADAISPYSYFRDGFAYLEEDDDLWTFVISAKMKGINIEQDDYNTNYESPVRNYPRFLNNPNWKERADAIHAAYKTKQAA